MGADLWNSGACDKWFDGCDESCRRLAFGVNGPQAEALSRISSHSDSSCFDLFRFGAPLYGDLPLSGNGVPCSHPTPASPEVLQSKALSRNTKLFKRLNNDKFAKQLFDLTVHDAHLGRMTLPTLLRVVSDTCPLNLRFGVEQGINKLDGSVKIRPVDDFSASGVNSCCRPLERLSTEGLDRLFLVCRHLVDAGGCVPLLWKADIDSAYRRIPILMAHRWAASVVFACEGKVYTSEHIGMPFGATGSLHA